MAIAIATLLGPVAFPAAAGGSHVTWLDCSGMETDTTLYFFAASPETTHPFSAVLILDRSASTISRYQDGEVSVYISPIQEDNEAVGRYYKTDDATGKHSFSFFIDKFKLTFFYTESFKVNYDDPVKPAPQLNEEIGWNKVASGKCQKIAPEPIRKPQL